MLDGFEPNTIASMSEEMIYLYEGVEKIDSSKTYDEDEVFYSSLNGTFTQKEYKRLCEVMEPNIIDNLTNEMIEELKATENLEATSTDTEGLTTIKLSSGKKLAVYSQKYEVEFKKPESEIKLNVANARSVVGYELSDGEMTRLYNHYFEISSDSLTFRNVNTDNAETLYEIGFAFILE